ncbi:GNAT family N-acetyltransferase [Microbulbifer variabilis]|uniref:GNAT family N-acetyltransferase n=1 Tax=Microbulbifer variabilis TaxID=266805 RepID=A0ABY4VET5_9GAMM|nr:GNAT family N-acetyltransferase [Microbulbifer variabilis]USD22505.1 GNAT family N-acetyltransferase [Microbulbifer variabilis]
MIQFIKTKDLDKSAKLTLANMQEYYDMYGVDWTLSDVRSAIENLENYDVVNDDGVFGIVRLSFENNRCQLRDIQVVSNQQNKGLGALVISKVTELARQKNLGFIDLRVFKRSPAYRLYGRLGFVIENEDDKFYQMTLTVI